MGVRYVVRRTIVDANRNVTIKKGTELTSLDQVPASQVDRVLVLDDSVSDSEELDHGPPAGCC